MEAELVIAGGTLVAPDGVRRGGLAIADGRIVAVGDDDDLPAGRERVDAGGLVLLPGVIDTHVHARDPSVDAREDFASATAAAAVGGITTILEMPISTPSVHDRATFEARAAIVGPKAHVDFGLYGGAAGDNLDTIEEQADCGCRGLQDASARPRRQVASASSSGCARRTRGLPTGAGADRPDRSRVGRPRRGRDDAGDGGRRAPGGRRSRSDEPCPMAAGGRRARLRGRDASSSPGRPVPASSSRTARRRGPWISRPGRASPAWP